MVNANVAQKCAAAVAVVNPVPITIADTVAVIPVTQGVTVTGVTLASDAVNGTTVGNATDPLLASTGGFVPVTAVTLPAGR